MSRPYEQVGGTVPVTVGLDIPLARAVDRYARRNGISRSAVIRRACGAFAPLADLMADPDSDASNREGSEPAAASE